MPRPESVAAAGYFPTPPRIASAISRHLSAPSNSGRRAVRLLDPCAGTGEAVAAIAASIGAETFGIELNSERAAAARQRLDHALATSAFSIREILEPVRSAYLKSHGVARSAILARVIDAVVRP